MLLLSDTWVHRYRDERLPKGPRFASVPSDESQPESARAINMTAAE